MPCTPRVQPLKKVLCLVAVWLCFARWGVLDSVDVENEDQSIGVNIVRRALEEPLRQIAANAGVEGSIVTQKVKEGEGDFGYNARTGEYVSLISAGVIDPTKVVRAALENAASVAGVASDHRNGLSLTSLSLRPAADAGHGHGGGMEGMGGGGMGF